MRQQPIILKVKETRTKPVEAATSPEEPVAAVDAADVTKTPAIAPEAPREPKKRKRATKEVTPEEAACIELSKAILKAYEEVMGEAARDIAWGRSGKAAKALAQRGYTVDQVVLAYNHMKGERFWADKIVHLDRVADNIGSILSFQNKGERAGESQGGRFSFRTLAPPKQRDSAPPSVAKPKITAPTPEAVEAARRRLQEQLGLTLDE